MLSRQLVFYQMPIGTDAVAFPRFSLLYSKSLLGSKWKALSVMQAGFSRSFKLSGVDSIRKQANLGGEKKLKHVIGPTTYLHKNWPL